MWATRLGGNESLKHPTIRMETRSELGPPPSLHLLMCKSAADVNLEPLKRALEDLATALTVQPFIVSEVGGLGFPWMAEPKLQQHYPT